MCVEQENTEQFLCQLASPHEIKLDEIPNVNLYMEQLLSFLNPRLQPLKSDQKALTKTMINNYCKDGLLNQPNNKKYTKDHMILLIILYNLKNILSIGDIKRLFNPILKDINTSEDDLIPLESIYTTFLELKQNQATELPKYFFEKFQVIKHINANMEEDKNREITEAFLMVMMLIAQANVCKQLAEKIIEQYF